MPNVPSITSNVKIPKATIASKAKGFFEYEYMQTTPQQAVKLFNREQVVTEAADT